MGTVWENPLRLLLLCERKDFDCQHRHSESESFRFAAAAAAAAAAGEMVWIKLLW
jgi:hypothetical protein